MVDSSGKVALLDSTKVVVVLLHRIKELTKIKVWGKVVTKKKLRLSLRSSQV